MVGMLQTDGSNFNRQNSSQYPQNNQQRANLAPPSQYQQNYGEENVYTNGAKNMADAIRQNSYGATPNTYMDQTGNSMGGMSIAMRMKQNRDALLGNQVLDQQQVDTGVQSLYAKNPFTGMNDHNNLNEFEDKMDQMLQTPQSDMIRQSPYKQQNGRI